jgi:hypothetical protein
MFFCSFLSKKEFHLIKKEIHSLPKSESGEAKSAPNCFSSKYLLTIVNLVNFSDLQGLTLK